MVKMCFIYSRSKDSSLILFGTILKSNDEHIKNNFNSDESVDLW